LPGCEILDGFDPLLQFRNFCHIDGVVGTEALRLCEARFGTVYDDDFGSPFLGNRHGVQAQSPSALDEQGFPVLQSSFQALQTPGTRENTGNPKQSRGFTGYSEARSVDIVHTPFPPS
jgi:hypothetical protein